MLKKLVKIGKLLLWVLLLWVPLPLSAQLDARAIMRSQQQGGNNQNLYGSNPFETAPGEEEEGQESDPSDTTKKKKKPRKPLESYFFSDSIRALNNFQWHVSRDYNRVEVMPIDTTLESWRIDYPFYRDGVGDAAVGGLGQASLPLNYAERPNLFRFGFAQGYHAYTYDMENVPFYNVKRPFIHFTYLESGQKKFREEHFELAHAQNITPSTGFSLNYKARGTRGQYARQRTRNHNLALTFSHTGRRYSVHAGYYNNHIEQQENGGVVGEWAIADTTFDMPSGVPMRLGQAQAENMYRNNGFFVEQSYGIPLQRMTDDDFSMAELSAVYVGHSFEYNAWSKVYSDVAAPYTDERGDRDESGNFIPTQGEYFKNWYINPVASRDSIYERVISNRFFVQAQPWDRDGVVGTINGGVGIDLHTYSQLAMESFLTGEYAKTNKTSIFAYGSIEGKIKKYADWGADFRLYPSGYRSGDSELGAHVALKAYLRGKPLILEGRFRTEKRSPGFWQENLFSNHYVWFTPLKKENETRFEVALRIPDIAFEAGVWQSVVNDKIYYDTESIVAQHSGSVSLTSVYARKDFRLGGFHFDNRVLLQWSTNQEVIPVPLASVFGSYYYEFWVVRDVLRMQLGVDGRFNTRYYAPSYNPALSVFYNQRDVEIGNYPYMDVFITGKWKRMRIFLKYQHINRGLFGNGEYFSVARYPLNPGMFKIGISWGFYD